MALDDYLLPDLRKVGITPVVRSIDANPDDTATTGAGSPLVIQQLRNAGVTSVIPLIPFNVLFPVLQAETTQQYFPKLLLSDYEGSIESTLGLLPLYAKALNGQEGLTTETLGGIDGPRPESQGGYDPGLRSCWVLWHKAYPQVPPGNMNDFIEEQGPIAGWCQAIDLFATAAKSAGRDLDRRTFVTAMSKITDFPGTWSTDLSYGPDKRYGPTRVPGGQVTRQLAAVVSVQDDPGPTSSGDVLGLCPTLRAAARRLTGPEGRDARDQLDRQPSRPLERSGTPGRTPGARHCQPS